MTLKLTCTKCGGNNLVYPVKMTDEAVVHCGDCGEGIGTIAQVTERVTRQVTGAHPRRRK